MGIMTTVTVQGAPQRIEDTSSETLRHIYRETLDRLFDLDSAAEFPMPTEQTDVLRSLRQDSLAILTELVQRERGMHAEPQVSPSSS